MKRLYASQAASAPLSVPGRRQALGIGPGFIRTEFLTTGRACSSTSAAAASGEVCRLRLSRGV